MNEAASAVAHYGMALGDAGFMYSSRRDRAEAMEKLQVLSASQDLASALRKLYDLCSTGCVDTWLAIAGAEDCPIAGGNSHGSSRERCDQGGGEQSRRRSSLQVRTVFNCQQHV